MASRLNMLLRKTSSVVWLELESLESVVERRMKDKIKAFLDDTSHLFHDKLPADGLFVQPLDYPTKVQNGHCRASFVPTAI